uniref:Nucleolar pre-ribosomal-associated protein 1 C-terminal domain-containing protein n=1 Tax=Anopheles farauti TaxID=69004 RepID=A0A182Q5I0_9DIPT
MTTKVEKKRKHKPNGEAEGQAGEKKRHKANDEGWKFTPKGAPARSMVFTKRRAQGYVEPTSEEKKNNKVAENFRRELKAGAMAMSAIRHFLPECYANPELILHYIRGGGTLKPLMEILASCAVDKLNDIADVLHLIQLVMLKSIDYDDTYYKYATRCARSIMTNHQTVLVSLLQDQSEHQGVSSKACALRVLRAILLVDAATYWRDVLRLVETCSSRMGMGACRESAHQPEGFIGRSLRTVFIEFNLAFLIDTPTQMVRYWLARKGLLQPLVQKLVYDSAENVILVMKTLTQYVLGNGDIDKYMYRTAFTPDILKALVAVYEWVGPEKQATNEHAKLGVLNATEEFLMPLLTSRRCFLVSKTIDLERASPRYRQLLVDLKHTQLHDHQRRLVLEILATCPEVLPATLDAYGGLMKSNRENNRELLKRMLLMHPPEELIGKLEGTSVSAKALSNFVVHTTLPRTILEHIGTALEGRKENIPYCLELLALMVTRCEQYLQVIEQRAVLDQFGLKKVKVDAINKIVTLFPSVDRIMAAMATHRDDRTAVKTNVTLEHAMDILLVCIRSFRAYIESSAFITTYRDILQPAYRAPEVEKYYLNYEFKAIKVVLALEPQSVSFGSPMFPPVLRLLTKVYLNAKADMKRDATEQLLALFRNTALFDNRGTEIEFWFQALKDVEPVAVPALVDFLAVQAPKAVAAENNRKTVDHTALIDEAFQVGASERRHDLEELFARVERDAENADTDGVGSGGGAHVELPVADRFFMYMFAAEPSTEKKPPQYKRYLSGVALRYLHYLPHPEVVVHVLKATGAKLVSPKVLQYASEWVAGKECVLDEVDATKFRPLSESFATSQPPVKHDASFLQRWKNEHSVLLNLFHQTLFYLSRWVTAGKLTPQHLDLIAHCSTQLLEQLTKPNTLSEREQDELLEGLFLQRPAVFQHFTIIKRREEKKEKESTRPLVSGFVCELMQLLHTLPRFERYTELYANKIVSELMRVSSVDAADAELDGELAERLLRIFKLNERHCVTLLRHYAQLPGGTFQARSCHYRQLCHALEQLVASNRHRQERFLPEPTVRGLVRIYKELSEERVEPGSESSGLDELENALHAYFSTFPHGIACIEPDLMRVLFENGRRIGKPLIKLATFLLARSPALHEPFLELVGQYAAPKKELAYPLLNVAFRRGILSETTLESGSGKRLLTQLYADFRTPILKMLEKPNKAAVIYRENAVANEQLVRLCMPRNECVDFARKKLRIEAVEGFQLRVLMEIYGGALKTTLAEGAEGDGATRQTVYCNGFAMLLQCFEAFFKSISSAQYLLQQDAQMARLNELVLATYRWSLAAARHPDLLGKVSYASVTGAAAWNTFCKNCLKYGLETVRCRENERRFDERLHVLTKLMAVLVERFYDDGEKERAEDVGRYYDWALSHSNFLRLLLLQYQYKPKTALVQLLYALARKNPSVVSEKHVPLLLGAYGATLTDANRYLLALLQHYERSGVQMHEFRPFLWGETAIKHFSLEASSSSNGETTGEGTKNGAEGTARPAGKGAFRTSVADVFALLQEDRMINTIENFPVWRKLDACAQLPETNFDDLVALSDPERCGLRVEYQPTTPAERFVEKARARTHHQAAPPSPHSELLEMNAPSKEQNAFTYDPAFLLPMLSFMYANDQADMLQRGIRCGILTLPFLCFASNDEQMRLASGNVLLRVRSHFEQSKRLIDVKTWLHLLATVQRRFVEMVREANGRQQQQQQQQHLVPRAPFLSMLFVAETVKVLPNVIHKLHGPLMQFIIRQDAYNFRQVPNFLPLFNNSEVENDIPRLFVVRTIGAGVKSHRDFAVLRASPVLQVLMGFHGSPLSNRELNAAILGVLTAITTIPKSCQYLVDALGFVGWISERVDVVESFEFDTIEALLGLLSNCWYSMQVMAAAEAASGSQKSPKQPRSTVFFQRSVLIQTLKFLPLLSTRSSSVTLMRFLNLLEKTTSSWHGYHHLLSLVDACVMERLMEYFENLFAEHMWCVRYARQCGGTYAMTDDDWAMGRKLQEANVDETTMQIVLALRRFVMVWCSFQKRAGGVEKEELLEEVDEDVQDGVEQNDGSVADENEDLADEDLDEPMSE